MPGERNRSSRGAGFTTQTAGLRQTLLRMLRCPDGLQLLLQLSWRWKTEEPWCWVGGFSDDKGEGGRIKNQAPRSPGWLTGGKRAHCCLRHAVVKIREGRNVQPASPQTHLDCLSFQTVSSCSKRNPGAYNKHTLVSPLPWTDCASDTTVYIHMSAILEADCTRDQKIWRNAKNMRY